MIGVPLASVAACAAIGTAQAPSTPASPGGPLIAAFDPVPQSISTPIEEKSAPITSASAAAR